MVETHDQHAYRWHSSRYSSISQPGSDCKATRVTENNATIVQQIPSDGTDDVGYAMIAEIRSYLGVDTGICDQVIADFEARIAFGVAKYGKHLQTHNQRNALVDAYQELLDAAHYFKQDHMETGRRDSQVALHRVMLLIFDLRSLLPGSMPGAAS